VKLLWRDLPQCVLSKKRDLGPDSRVVEPIDINAGQPVSEEGRPQGQFHGTPLALALNPLDGGA
jgi:hypothetical protein